MKRWSRFAGEQTRYAKYVDVSECAQCFEFMRAALPILLEDTEAKVRVLAVHRAFDVERPEFEKLKAQLIARLSDADLSVRWNAAVGFAKNFGAAKRHIHRARRSVDRRASGALSRLKLRANRGVRRQKRYNWGSKVNLPVFSQSLRP